MRVWALLVVATLAFGCSSNKKQGPKNPGNDSGVALSAACEKTRATVTAVYSADPALAALKKDELRSDTLAANVDMAMRDCAADPDRVAPCLSRAADVATLERDCLIPLDDMGQAEHRAFGKTQ